MSEREFYVREMQKYIPVKLSGACPQLQLTKKEGRHGFKVHNVQSGTFWTANTVKAAVRCTVLKRLTCVHNFSPFFTAV